MLKCVYHFLSYAQACLSFSVLCSSVFIIFCPMLKRVYHFLSYAQVCLSFSVLCSGVFIIFCPMLKCVYHFLSYAQVYLSFSVLCSSVFIMLCHILKRRHHLRVCLFASVSCWFVRKPTESVVQLVRHPKRSNIFVCIEIHKSRPAVVYEYQDWKRMGRNINECVQRIAAIKHFNIHRVVLQLCTAYETDTMSNLFPNFHFSVKASSSILKSEL